MIALARLKRLVKFLGILAIVFFAVFLSLVYVHGLRIPGYQFDNFNFISQIKIEKMDMALSVEGGFIKQTNHAYVIRAYSPPYKNPAKR